MDNNMEKDELLEQEQPQAEKTPVEACEEVTDAAVETPAEACEEVTDAAVEENAEETVAPETTLEQKKGSKVWLWIVGIGCVLVLSVVVAIAVLVGSGAFNPEETTEATTAPQDATQSASAFTSYTVTDEKAAALADGVVAQIGNSKLTNSMLQIFYRAEVYNFLSQYGYYISMFGLDPTQPLDQQPCFSDNTISWQQYFLESAINNWKSYAVLNEMAAAEGYTLTQDGQNKIANVEADLQKNATDNGYASLEEMVTTEAGAGATVDGFISYQKMLYASLDYFDTKYTAMTPTEAEIIAHYDENAASYEEKGITKGGIRVDVRHILVKVGTTTDENGQAVSTDADWESCQVKAQLILDQWKAGAATEESFGTLAGQITEDGGSKATGGLYENVVDGDMVTEFNDWIMDESRVPGDTGLVKTQFGYHVMYFCDSEEIPTQEQKWYTTVQAELLSARFDEFYMGGEEKYPMTTDYSKIGLTEIPLS